MAVDTSMGMQITRVPAEDLIWYESRFSCTYEDTSTYGFVCSPFYTTISG